MSARTHIPGGSREPEAANPAKSAPERPDEPRNGPSGPQIARTLAEYHQIDRDPRREALAAAEAALNDPLMLADDRDLGVLVLLEARAAELAALPGLIDGLPVPDNAKARLRHPARAPDA